MSNAPVPRHPCHRALCACRSPSITDDLPCVSWSWDCCVIALCSFLDLSHNALSAASASILWHTWPAVDVSGNALAGPLPTPGPGVVPVTTHLNVSFNNYTGPLPIATVESLPEDVHGAVFDLSCNYFDLAYAYKLQQYCDNQGDTCLYQAQFPNATCVARGSGVPAAPTHVAAVRCVRCAIVSWDPPEPGTPTVTSYVVLTDTVSLGHRARADAASSASAAAAASANTTCASPCTNATVQGLDPGVAYMFTVVAVGPGGSSAPSSPSNAVTPCAVANQVPDAPSSLTPAPGVDSVSVTWVPSPSSPCWQGPVLAWNVTAVGSVQGTGNVVRWAVLPAANVNWTLSPVTRASGYAYSFQVRALELL